MAQLIFEPFNDNQTALAVQSLLESQNIPESVTVDDDDLFQCGKCKKEFTNLMNFLNHKQGQCLGEVANASSSQPLTLQTSMDLSTSNTSIVYTTHFGHAITKQLNAYGGVSLSSLMPGMVLGDEIISFHTVDPSSSIPLSSAIQNGSYLSQVEPMMLNVKNSGSAIYSTIGEPTFSASTGDFAGVIDSSQLQFQQVATSSESPVELQQVIISMPPQSESGIEALFSSQMQPSNCIVDPSNHDRKMRSALDVVVPAGSDLDCPLPRHGKMPIAPSCTTVATATPSEDASRRKLKCQYCEKAFLKNFDLQQHLRSHTGEKPFQCIVCGRAFAQKSNVKKHMQTHKVWPQGLSNTLPTAVIVPVMPKSDAPTAAAAAGAVSAVPCSLPSINDHLQAAAGDAESEKGFQVLMNCDSTTGQLFVKQWSTMISVQQDTTPDGEKVNVVVDNSYICQYCGSKFCSYFQLKSHLVIHKNEQVYKCVLKACGECFRELDEFLEHTKIHENEMTYRCYVCNKTFGSLYELGTHQYSHSLFPNEGPKLGPKYFRCVKCKNKYATPEALQHHLETISHNFPCPYCSKLFTCERYLRRHLPTHGTVGEYHCEVCMKPFKTEHYLKMHMVTHSDKKPFHCDKCSRSFNRRDKLKRHLLIHDPVKKFKCPFRSVGGCTKEFNRGDKLKAHIISHTGVKPYKCKICNKFFTRRPHLREHERTHTNSFQFSCSRCRKGFRRQKLLREHVCSSAGKGSSLSPESPADCKEAVIQSIADARGSCFQKKRVISNKVAIPRRGRPPKQTTVSTALHSDDLTPVGDIVNNQEVKNAESEQTPVSLNQSSLAIASMIAIDQASGSGNIMTIDQALDAVANSSLHGCVDGAVGSVLTLEQSANGTFYVIKPFLGKVEDLSSACLVESSSSSIEALRMIPVMSRRSENQMTLVKNGRLVTGGQTTVIVGSSPDDHVPKTEVGEGLCQVIFTDDGTTG